MKTLPQRTRKSGTATKPTRPAPMVKWLHPTNLFRTGVDAMISSVFGDRADRRLLEAVASPQAAFFNYSGADAGPLRNEWVHNRKEEPRRPKTGDFWLDYVADAGDGFDSTYAVAYQVSRRSLPVEGHSEPLPRGDVLVFGGDQVYPVASREEYERRLVAPYELASIYTPEPSPHVFAIPGNHDWYDGLASFLRLFAAGRWIAGRHTQQRLSYFALKLPKGWWLFGTDVQLSSDIDAAQVAYFKNVVKQQMAKDDRIILLNAEPAWVYGATPRARRAGYIEHNLTYLQGELENRVRVFLAGDLHHYRRHESPDGVQRITCGGGGAFLHPTHAPKLSRLADGSAWKASFPSPEKSRQIALRTLALLKDSPKFGVITGTLYLVLALSARAEVGTQPLSAWLEVFGAVVSAAILSPVSIALTALFVLGCVGFADARYGRVGRWVAGGVHAFVHLAVAFHVAWGATYLTVTGLHLCEDPPFATCDGHAGMLALKFAVASGLTFFGGWIAGTCLLAVYLLISVNAFGRHGNEAFGGMANADWKCFLRMRIDAEGALTLFPIGLERVPRKWREVANPDDDEAALVPEEGSGTPPCLIEPPVPIR